MNKSWSVVSGDDRLRRARTPPHPPSLISFELETELLRLEEKDA